MFRRLFPPAVWCLFLILIPAWVLPAAGQTDGRVETPQGTFASLSDALAQVEDGDTVEVYGGHYEGPIVVERSVTLIGHDWPVIDGGGQGTVVKLAAPNILLRGFVIRDSGDTLYEENSGIAVEARNVVVEGNRLEDTLFGIYLREATGSVVRNNDITSKDLDVPRRGDPIRVWYSNGVLIEDNRVNKGRDVVLWYSERLTVRNNEISDGRYGLHFMYCHDATIENNLLIQNSVGTFMMYSNRLHLSNNTIAYNRGPSGYGVGLKDMDDAVLTDNLFLDNRIGAHLDNSPSGVDSIGHFEGNIFAFNDVGVNLMPSVRHNQFLGNSFVDNGEQVSISGGQGGRVRENAWSLGDQGNFWSDYVGYDGDGDQRGDVPYKAERLFENLIDQNSSLRLFVYSPVEQAVDFAARAIPFVKPQPKLTDDAPMMAPILPAALPALPDVDQRPLWAASVGLLALALLGLGAVQKIGNKDGKLRPTRGQASARLQYSITHAQGEPMVQVRNLTKRFGKLTAVERLTFEVGAGEAVALWGANGAGKTTALRCLLGAIPFEGRVEVGGKDVSYQAKSARKLLGFVPQEISFHDTMTVQETLRFYAQLKKTRTQDERTGRLLERLGLLAYNRKRVRDLSGGMKQRLALAIALLADPPLLILDEPTANLDVKARGQFLALLSELKDAGKTFVFSSHRLEEVATLADRVLVLEAGKLVADCQPADLGGFVSDQAVLKLHLAGEEWIGPAMETLEDYGFSPQRNGNGIWVQVVPLEKARPISVLTKAGIPVSDFQVE